MQGRLIVFEGTDGSGKATQTALLCQELDRRGIAYRRLEFPRYKEESSALIRLYLSGAFGSRPGRTGVRTTRREAWSLRTVTPPPMPFTRRPSSLRRSAAATWSGCLTLNIGSWDCQSRTGCYIWISPRKFLSG